MSSKTEGLNGVETWDPVTGCTKISSGCKNCHAERMTRRFWKTWERRPPPNHFGVKLHMDRLEQPVKWLTPRMIFVCSMGDLFHEDVPDEWINTVLLTAGWRAKQHTYLFLTKRPQRMKSILRKGGVPYPDNLWFGVTAEDQACPRLTTAQG